MTTFRDSLTRLALVATLLWLLTASSSSQPHDASLPEARPAKSMKGYELYSWEQQGEWYFALLAGTNRSKASHEVTAPEVRVHGVDALMSALEELSKGQQVFWSATSAPNMAFRDERIVEQIRKHCRQTGITLEIVR
jgi:hypothetical protein